MNTLSRAILVVVLGLSVLPVQANVISDAGFEGLGAPTSLPNNGLPAGAWAITEHEASDDLISIAAAPTGGDGDALHLSSHSDGQAAGQTFSGFSNTRDKLITYHQRYIGTSDNLGGALTLGRSGFTSIGNNAVMLIFGNDSNKTDIQYFAGGYNVLAPFDAGHWYEVRVDVDLDTALGKDGTVDYFLRSDTDSRYARWIQIGWNCAFAAGISNSVNDISRIHIGQYNRSTDDDAYFDNVFVSPAGDIRPAIYYQNGFESPTYTAGQTAIGQDGWKHNTSYGSTDRATIEDLGSPHGQVFQLLSASGGGFMAAYQDLDAVVDAGTAVFSLDAQPIDINGTTAFYLGGSKLIQDSGGHFSEDTAAYFGFSNGGTTGTRLYAYNGNGTGSGTSMYFGDVPDGQWYHFDVRVHLTGADRNTWDVSVYDESSTLLGSLTGLGFRTDYVDITRLGLLCTGAGSGMYFDNLDLRTVPEPTSLTLLALGSVVAVIAARRRRRRA